MQLLILIWIILLIVPVLLAYRKAELNFRYLKLTKPERYKDIQSFWFIMTFKLCKWFYYSLVLIALFVIFNLVFSNH
jgi:hypothetical protein